MHWSIRSPVFSQWWKLALRASNVGGSWLMRRFWGSQGKRTL